MGGFQILTFLLSISRGGSAIILHRLSTDCRVVAHLRLTNVPRVLAVCRVEVLQTTLTILEKENT